MGQVMSDFLGRDPQLLGLAEVVRAWASGPAKVTARKWGIDPKTAENVSQGVVSSKTLEKAVQAEGWPLLLALGHALTGLSFDDWIGHELEKARQGAAELEALAERSRAARNRMADRADEPRSFAEGRRNSRRTARSVGDGEA